jgi:hypothetical protein
MSIRFGLKIGCDTAYKMSTSISGTIARDEASIIYLSINCIG